MSRTLISACPPAPSRPLLAPSRALAALGVGGLLLSGCGSDPVPAEGSGADLRGKLPASIRAAGVLRIGSYLNYVPVDFKTPDGRPAGLDPDLADALAGYLGLRAEFVDMPFDQLTPAVQTKQVDLAMSAVIDTRQRQTGTDDEGRQVDPGVDFVDYFMSGTSIVVKAGNPAGVNTLDSLCGHTVAVQRGTLQDAIMGRQTVACAKLAKPLQLHSLTNDDQALTEVGNGTAVAGLNDYPVAVYNTTAPERGGRFQLTSGHFVQSGPYGITLGKENTRLRDVLARTLDQLLRNGTYDKVLTKWNIGPGAVSSAIVNGGL
ncbi:ABC transporter substrate-binding protein [Kitasatospora sp. NBC_00240]|uniref:ABC transporter substrate-binding protein n=1 Tax=Kitasatospora sp. NBC_00240 TaxID=2903567 RepID=UPI002254CE14|nr:ABC transporter substrate-binding protein [Kitasatospora sp. NBC_00240]MCX5209629.1 ABC transporter substrate-binding protein [Kitasatospora sp. NBC_00240]